MEKEKKREENQQQMLKESVLKLLYGIFFFINIEDIANERRMGRKRFPEEKSGSIKKTIVRRVISIKCRICGERDQAVLRVTS